MVGVFKYGSSLRYFKEKPFVNHCITMVPKLQQGNTMFLNKGQCILGSTLECHLNKLPSYTMYTPNVLCRIKQQHGITIVFFAKHKSTVEFCRKDTMVKHYSKSLMFRGGGVKHTIWRVGNSGGARDLIV